MVCAEKCFDSSECSHMTCDTGYDVACTSHVCTCEMSGGGGGHGHTGNIKRRFIYLFSLLFKNKIIEFLGVFCTKITFNTKQTYRYHIYLYII